ncbi:MAG: 3-phosphoshikimate 1-carboxyvinyltransferase, partial [Spirochaetales bacterium]|nr:3-phosphoshikimate 1-carboxyvinyltransferase [Spirochaetales bacterium]
IAVMCAELKKLGADISELEDGLVINHSPLKGGKVCGHDDHRVVMSMAVAGLSSSGPIEIDNADAAAITFPGFFTLLDSVRD